MIFTMLASICIASHKRPQSLARTLSSIVQQQARKQVEIIVVEDSRDGVKASEVASYYGVDKFVHLNRALWTNPSKTWNSAFKLAEADTLIIQQADVMHARPNTIEQLIDQCNQGEAIIARVDEYDPISCNIGTSIMDPTKGWFGFFLGAIKRKDVYRVGGMCEDFTEGAHDDVWFQRCLEASGVNFRHTWEICGLHQSHERIRNAAVKRSIRKSRKLLNSKTEAGCFFASGGPWRLP